MSSVIKIRAHHLLCLQGYQGYGYSNIFTANLERIIKLIGTAPDLEIEVVAGNDVICRYCPYTSKSGCRKDANSAPRIRSLDLKVLAKLNLQTGSKAKAENLIRLTSTKFKTAFDLRGICDDCLWKEKCLWFKRFQITAIQV